jgi:hypothetical protein
MFLTKGKIDSEIIPEMKSYEKKRPVTRRNFDVEDLFDHPTEKDHLSYMLKELESSERAFSKEF